MVFTGIIKAVGQGVFDAKSQILEVKAPAGFWQGLDAGDSVAIDGVCLTLLEAPSDSVPGRFFLQKETLQCTTFGDADWNGAGARAVNVEAALQMHERLSGHLVLGHVHGVASVDSVQRNDDGSTEVWLRLPAALPAHLAQPVVVHKGSISLDGVSLTVAQVANVAPDSDQLRVRVSLIPYTLGHTTLQFWQPGRRVNVEFAFAGAGPSYDSATSKKQELAAPPKWMGLDYVQPSVSPSLAASSHDNNNNDDDDDDEAFMNEAIALAEQGRETAPPNPWVGCLIVAGGGRVVLGRGYHSAAGQAHAEVQALRNALQVQYPGMTAAEAQALLSSVGGGQRQLNFLSGATLYVTLEPCVGFAGKRTPPCAGLLAALGLARVVVAIEDPDVAVRGRGVAALRAAGVRVDVGVAAERAARSLAAYIKQRSTGVPYVVCKAACSLDGAVAAQDGSSKWITDAACRQHAHRTLRARSGAIVVGSGTALADDPELTVRCCDDNDKEKKQPLRVLLDSRGRVERGRLLCCDVAPTLVFTTAASRGSVARQRWSDAGVDVVELPGQRVDLHAVLRTLGGRGVLQVLLEGGAELHSAALAAGVVDRLVLYQGGVLLGSTAARWLREPLTRSMRDVDGDERRWRVEHVQALGTAGMVSEWVSSTSSAVGTPLQQARARVSRAVGQIRSGGMVLVTDDAARENEADLVVAAALVSEAQVATMIRHTTGILCAPMPAAHAERLQLPLMVANNEDAKKTAFTVSCDAVGVSTGVSALERRLTAHVLASADSRPADLTRPGHVFPLIEHPGSVHARAGHTEASVALCRLAGIDPPVALIGELTNDDGTMSRLDDAEAFSRRNGALPILSVADLQLVLSSTDTDDTDGQTAADVAEPLSRAAVIALARDGIDVGDWTVQMFGAQHPPSLRHTQRSSELIVLTKGDVVGDTPPLCRVHSACFTADCLGSVACDCGAQLSAAMRAIEHEGRGVLLYMLQHEGRGIGLANKLDAYALMQSPDWNGHTYDANVALGFAPDERCYAAAAAALRALRLPAVRLLTNNPAKLAALQAAGVSATRTPLHAVAPSPRAAKYLSDKQRFGQHHPTTADQATTSQHHHHQHKSLPALAPLLSPERAASLRVTVVRTAWNARLVDALVDGVVARLAQHGVTNVLTVQVGGAYELPLTAKRAAANADAVVAIGILIKGETMHFEYISSAVSSGLMSVQLETDTPVIYGVLNVLDEHQAEARCRPDSGLASSWADTALSQIANDPRLSN